MAYTDRLSGTSRATSIATVGLIHAAIGTALIYGFAPNIVKIIDRGPLVVTSYPVDPPPPPTERVKESKPSGSVVNPPRGPIELPPRGPEIPMVIADPLPPTSAFTPPAIPNAPPVQQFTPKAPAPANDPSRWATTNDYPASALRREEQGVTRFRVVVSSDGRPLNCEVTASSGSKLLDDKTCDLVESRARFEPATNDAGERIVGTYSNAVRWQLPK